MNVNFFSPATVISGVFVGYNWGMLVAALLRGLNMPVWILIIPILITLLFICNIWIDRKVKNDK